jgi:formate dehydrogenase subunit delta
MSTPDAGIKLAQMAGQIAEFFRPYPDEHAIAAIADHINQFWNPRMREALVARFRPDDPSLAPRVGKALAAIRVRPSSV